MKTDEQQLPPNLKIDAQVLELIEDDAGEEDQDESPHEDEEEYDQVTDEQGEREDGKKKKCHVVNPVARQDPRMYMH